MFRHRALPALIGAVLMPALAAPAASAAGWSCSADAISGTVLGVPVETVAANAGATECRTESRSLSAALPTALEAQALAAATRAGARDALAVGAVADLRVRALPTLPIALPRVAIPDSLGSVTIPLGILGLPSSMSVDLRPALQALVPERVLPEVDLVRVQAATAYAAGACRDGRPALAGVSQVAGLQVLGQDLAAGSQSERTLTLLNGGTLDPSDVDLSLVDLGVFDTSLLRPLIESAIRPVLEALPEIPIPATLAQARITPGDQTTGGGVLIQRALRIEVSIAGQSLADLALGRAAAGEAGVDCAQPAGAPSPATPAQLALECTTRRLVLVDVVRRGGRVHLEGVADPRLAGRVVDLVFGATGRRVAQARVAEDGTFRATTALPPRRLRTGNRARYRAVLGGERSLNLKLERRMVVDSVRGERGTVTIAGRVVRPLARPVAPVELRRRLSCGEWEVVARVRPERDGRFRVTVAGPGGQAAAVYRLATRVRRTARNRKTFPTFTLPRAAAHA